MLGACTHGAARVRASCLAAVAFAACAIPAMARAETFFQVDGRVGGFYAAVTSRPEGAMATTPEPVGGALLAGLRVGGLTWFGDDPIVGLLYTGGIEIGPEFPVGKVTGTAVFSAAIGPAFRLAGPPRRATLISVGWAPRLMLNFAKPVGEVASPLGVELAFHVSRVRFPLWFCRTLDKANFFGFGLGFDFRT